MWRSKICIIRYSQINERWNKFLSVDIVSFLCSANTWIVGVTVFCKLVSVRRRVDCGTFVLYNLYDYYAVSCVCPRVISTEEHMAFHKNTDMSEPCILTPTNVKNWNAKVRNKPALSNLGLLKSWFQFVAGSIIELMLDRGLRLGGLPGRLHKYYILLTRSIKNKQNCSTTAK